MIITLAIVALQASAVYCAWRAVTSARTAQGASGWVIFLLAAPYLAVPAFLFLGHHRYRGYKVSRLASEQVVEGLRRFYEAHRPAAPPVPCPAAFEKIAEMPAVRGNDLELLIDGADTFAAIFDAIDSAEDYVLVQFYIVHDDDIGRALHARMTAAAARGVTVRFMVDAIGSHALPKAYFDTLNDAGVIVIDPRDRRRRRHRFQINYRNHRKTVIVDGRLAFTGGLNVGDEYMGRDASFGAWRDTHVALKGPVVQQLQLIFAEDWHWASGATLKDALHWDVAYAEADRTALIVATGPADPMETGGMLYFSAITAARERIWIASPYCVPENDVLTALKHAALRGVDVRLLLPEIVDHRIPWLAAHAYFDELRAAGVRILRYTEGFMHQKIILVDRHLAGIGTTNLDNRSFRLNFEAMAVFFDRGAADMVAGMLERDFARSFELTRRLSEQPRHVRLGAPVARLFAPLL